MGSGQGSSQSLFTAAIAVLFDSVFVDGNTYSVSITTTAPGAPQSLSTTATSTSDVTLNWSAPSSIGGSAITGYKYRYKVRGAAEFGDWTAISGSANLRSYVVGDLEDSTDYIFQMLATNKSGDGLHSGEVTGSTLAGQPTVILVLDRNRISEDRGESTVTAILDRTSSVATTVTVSASAVSPATASDFTLSSNKVLTIAAEQTTSTGTVTITAVDNADDDDNRQVTVSGVAMNAGGVTQPSSQTLTIADDESASTTVTLTVSPTSVAEDATGADRTVTVTATLDAAARTENTEVTVSVAAGTAVEGTDFSAVNDFTLTIAGGATSGTATFDLVPLDDAIDEPAETVTVTAATAVPGLAVKPEAGRTVTITDDEDAPTVTLVLAPDSISEDEGSSTVTATLSHPSNEATTVTVSASPVTPAEAGDYTLSENRTLTIAAGSTTSTGTVTVEAVDNLFDAASKSVTVSGSADNTLGVEPPSSQTLTITDDESPTTTVTLTVSPGTVSEGATGMAQTVTVTAAFDGAPRPADTAVTVSVADGTAVAGTDYTAVSNVTITIATGDTSGTATFTLAPVDDNVDEPNETVVVTGTTTVSGLNVAPPGGLRVTVEDDDDAPAVKLVLSPGSVSENGGSSTVTAELEHPSSEETTVRVSASPVTPAEAGDYTLSGSVLTIVAGQTASTGTVTIAAEDNNVHAPDKRVTVSGSARNDQGVEPPSSKTLTITENDTASDTVELTVSPTSLSEGAAEGERTVTVTATLDAAARPADAQVTVSVTGDTATAGTDFSVVAGFTVTIEAGQTSGTGTFTLAPVDDARDEPDETVLVRGTTTVSGLTVSPEAGRTVTIVDNDDAPTVTKRDQTLTGFSYSPAAVTIGDTAPTVTAPSGAQTTLSYSATPSTVCTVDSSTGALTLVGVGSCVITATAASSDDYNEATATYTVTALDRPRPITTPDEPRAPLVSSGDGSVIAQWLPPAWDGGTPILRYEYCLKPIYQCNDAWVAIPDSAPGGANHGWYAIASSNGTYTRVYLRAVNEQGAGPNVSRAAVPLTGTPAAPTNLRGEALSAEYIKISWNEPAAPAGVTITGYQLESSHDGVTWAHDFGCQYPCSQKYLGGRWQPRGTNSVTVRVLENATLHYRIRTFFRTNTAPIVSGMDFSRGASPTSPIIVVTTVGASGTLALPELGVSDGYGHEGTNAAIVFDVRLTGAYRQTSPVTVSYRTQDGTARAGSDYTAGSGTLVFEPGETAKTVSVPIIDDTVEDSGEEFALLLSNVSGAILSRSGGLGTIYNSEDIVTGFTLVDAASGTDVGGLEHGGTVTLDDPTNGQYGIRAGTAPGTGVNSVRLDLSGAKTATRTDDDAPYTLYAEGGEGLPPGAYTLQATAYPEAGGGGNALQTISVSFTVAASTQDEDEATALSATFPTSPYASKLHRGASDRPQVVVAFSEAVTAITANTPSAVASGGTISAVSAHTEDGLENAWTFFLTPEGGGDVTFTLTAGAACDSGGICTASGTTLTEVPAARTLPGPGGDDDNTGEPETTGLTASFSAMPSEHAGPGERFSFELSFGEVPKLGFRKLRDDAFTITGGAVRIARRLERPSNIRWHITVEPSDWGEVAISLPGGRACTSSGGICTSDNRMLANSPSAIVQGPATLSVADANAREGTDATLDFAVTLDRASPTTVTVHYATEDGTAAAGADYTATSGTLSFAPGDLAKTVSVPILDDAHDEGSETLTLTLSNATGARIRDAGATGTIENSDPIPKAWLARFGRTVADHVVDAVGERLEGSPGGGSQVTLGGQRIPLGGAGNGPFPGSTAGSDTREDGTAADTLAAFADRISGDGAGTGRVDRGDGGAEDAARRRASRTLNEREMLLGSSFVLALGGAGGTGTAWTAWGRPAASGFDGVADGLSVDGEVTTFTLGADAARGRWLGGVALAHSTGEGGFRDHADSDHDGGGTGTLESTLASVHPYLRFRASERLSLWGVLGYGTGDLTLSVDAAGTQPRRTWKTDTGMWMAASGARGVLLSAPDTGGFELAARGDVRFVGMRSEASTGADGAGPLAATESQTSRLRFLLEGSHRIELAGGQTLRPSLEVGLRHDGGDAEIGTSIEVGAGVSYADPELGLTVEGKARGLVAHKATDYREWGASGSVRIDPGATGRGLAISLSPAWGADTGGAERLWSARDARGLGARDDSFEPAGRLEAEAGYGLGAFGGRGVMTPFAGLALSDAGNRTWRGGVRWTLGPTVAFGVEGALRETANDNAAEHEIGFKLTARF